VDIGRPSSSNALLDNLLLFGRVLRRAGIAVHPGRMLDVVAALEHIDLSARDDVFHAIRALLVHRHDQMSTFDRAFAAFWREHVDGETSRSVRPDESRTSMVALDELLLPDSGAGSIQDPPDEERFSERGLKTWSDSGGLRDKDFAAFTADEAADARVALSRLVWNPGERRTRRWVRGIRGHGPRVDLRRAIAESLRTGGDIVRLPRRRRRIRPRPLVLLCDVSGSMEHYSRMLLQFAHAVAWRRPRPGKSGRPGNVEAFLFSTQLTRITRQLRLRRPDAAVAAVARSVPDWSGGTRIADAIKEFHQRWGGRVLSGSPVVLLISDGWDCGDPEELGRQIARLQRRCYRLVWLNPHIGTEGYAPLTRGLQAALPFVDDFLPSRTLNNLASLALHLNALPRRTRLVRMRAPTH
jgi:uncharacterized protein with von Willebrand factor type A (vWA) domain